MPLALEPLQRAKAVRYLLLRWKPEDIAHEIRCHPSTIYRIQANLWKYGTSVKPHIRLKGQPCKITPATEALLIDFLVRNPTSNQTEMAWFMWEECGVSVTQSTVSRVLKRVKWTKKKARRQAQALSLDLRRGYLSEMACIRAEQMVFLDESMFNETTGWRLTAWAPLGEAARYLGDLNRGHAWSFLAAYSSQGYLPGWVIKEGYFNTLSFHQWLVDELLPRCNAFPGLNSVIIMDNASSHCDPMIADCIRERGCLVRYLPPYSPDFNPIELTFSVLKAWVRRRFHETWPQFEGTFGEWLTISVRQSRCDRFAEAHFRHSGNGGYVFEGDMDDFDRRLRAYEQGTVEEMEI